MCFCFILLKARKNASDSNKLQEKEEQRHNDEITKQDEMQVEGKDDVISKPTATDGDDGIAHSLAADMLKENLKGTCKLKTNIVHVVSHITLFCVIFFHTCAF